jgi:hypothetical protein
MKHSLLVVFVLALAPVILFSQTSIPPSVGDGSSGNPYQIATLNNLFWVTQNSSSWNKYFIQTTDIDASTTSSWNSGSGWSPLGNVTTSFTGTFDGNNKTISGLTINRSDQYQGFFGIFNGGTLINIGLVNVAIIGTDYTSGVVAYGNSGTITNSYVTGSVTGTVSVGGFIGEGSVTLSNSYSSAIIVGSVYAGGLAGYYYGAISNCYASGNISASSSVGGLVGTIDGATITNCYATGAIGASGGGLVGANYGTITNSFASGSTTFVKSGPGTVTGGGAITTEQMKTLSTFTGAGWDFTTVWEMIGTNYPRLRTNPDGALGNYSLSFNGTSDYVSIPASSAWAFGTGDLTVEWWQYETDNNSYPRILSVGAGDIAVSIEEGSTIYCWLKNGITGFPVGPYMNTWVHFAFTRSSSIVSIYKNGSLLGTGTNGNDINNTSSALYLGKEESGNNFGGQLDEVRIWNIALTQGQIQATMNSELIGNEYGLVAYYKMSNRTGTTLTDDSFSGGHDGTITGATWVDASSSLPLPVELTSFTASASNNAVSLSWITATEVNNYGFNIERRAVNSEQLIVNSWAKIGFVAGNGTSNSSHSYSYADNNASSGTYAYRLKQIDNNGTYKYSQESEVTVLSPKTTALHQNYPNPFNPTTQISYDVALVGNVRLAVYDILGREVAVLVNEQKAPGSYAAEFNGAQLSSGVYFFKLTTNQFSSVRKMTLMK